ncbi:hypothetical protein J1N35_025881, partial [Gossypium stocksii]
GYNTRYDWYTYSHLVASDKQDEEASLEELDEDWKKPDSDNAFKDGMSKCCENIEVIKKAKPLDECVEPDTIEVENKAFNTIVEHESLSVNFQHQMEARKFSEDVHITKEICDYCE